MQMTLFYCLFISSLQLLINSISRISSYHKLLIYTKKTVILKFNEVWHIDDTHTKVIFQWWFLARKKLQVLGLLLRCKTVFSRCFVFLSRKFYSIDIDTFYALFRSFCTSFYGSDLWMDKSNRNGNFKELGIA